MTKIEIIDETVAYYSDVSKRSVNNSRCLYKSPTGNECAFQRVVEDDLSNFEGMSAKKVMGLLEKIKFKKGYQGHESSFWHLIQKLHDIDDHWDENGFTEVGKEFVYRLKQIYE